MATNRETVFDTVTKHPGLFAADYYGLLKNMAKGSVSSSLSKMASENVLRAIPAGNGQGLRYWPPDVEPTNDPGATIAKRRRRRHRSSAQKQTEVLVLLPIGKNRSEPVSMDEARVIWMALNPIFAGK